MIRRIIFFCLISLSIWACTPNAPHILIIPTPRDTTDSIVPDTIPPVHTTDTAAFSSLPYIAGKEGYASYRIPALLYTKSGKLLAFIEARKNSSSDTGDIDLCVKSSDNKGKTWSTKKLIFGDDINTCGNPSPVQLANGRIALFMCWQKTTGSVSAYVTQAQENLHTRRVFYTYSDDDGQTWSNPQDMTSTLKRANWQWYATGPVHAIQKIQAPNLGRILIPCNHTGTGSSVSHVIYSDDNGQTWALGGNCYDGGNESCLVELSNGSIMSSQRNTLRAKGTCRAYAISANGGESWSPQQYHLDLPEPGVPGGTTGCQASVVNYVIDGRLTRYLLFTNPADPDSRIKMTLSISSNDGSTWDKKYLLWSGPCAYSDIVVFPDGSCGFIYENGVTGRYERLTYQYIPAQEMRSMIGLN